MTKSYPKRGKKSSRPGTAAQFKEQKLGSCYFSRQTMLSSDRLRELGANDYGKKAQAKKKEIAGIAVNPRRTIITGASPKQPVDPQLPY